METTPKTVKRRWVRSVVMGSNGQQQTDLDMKKAGLLITTRGPGRTSWAECTVRQPGLATRGYRCVCLITVLEEAESGLRPSALEQPCVGADLHLHRGQEGVGEEA